MTALVELEKIKNALRPEAAPPGTVVVIGVGWVQIRKGVDLFIAVAAAVLRAASPTRFRFVLVGGGYDPIDDQAYSTYLAEQIEKSDLMGISSCWTRSRGSSACTTRQISSF